MIKFGIKDHKTGKTKNYAREDVTVGEAEKYCKYLELVSQEDKEEVPNATKMRQKEQQLLVDLFKDKGLIKEDVLNKMSTRTYTRASQDIFREINGEDEEGSETEPEEMGKTEEQSQ